jgi:hypothetical protein
MVTMVRDPATGRIQLTQAEAMAMFGGQGANMQAVQAQQQKPSQGGSALGAVGTLGGMYAGQQLAQGGFSGLGSSISGLFGGGGSAATGAAASSGATGAGSSLGSMTLPTQLGINGPTAAGSAGSGSSGVLGGLGAALPWLGVGGIALGTGLAAKGAWDAAKNKGTMGGLKAGIKSAGALNAVPLLAQAVWGAGALRGALGGKKHEDQYARDHVRSGLKDSGFVDDAYNVTLADGSKFDIGIDGADPRYNVDFNREGAGGAVAANQALGHYLTGGGKLKDDFTGYLSNAAMSGGDVRANAKQFIATAGLDHDKLYGAIHMDETLDQATKDAMKNGLDELYGVGAYAKKGQKASAAPVASPELLQASGLVGYNPNRVPQVKGKPATALLALGAAKGTSK